jgi:glucose/arabinose dehydrogenase
VLFQDDPSNLFDARKRRLYIVNTVDNRSVAVAMLAAGLAKATGVGPEAAAMAAAEAMARQNGTGCLWGAPPPPPRAAARLEIAAAGDVLPGFADDTMASGLIFPTAFAILPSGNRVLVLEQEGYVRLVESGVLKPTKVLDITSQLNNYDDRGLLGLVIDPSFATNGYIYLYFTYEHNSADPFGKKTNHVVRYTMSGNTVLYDSSTRTSSYVTTTLAGSTHTIGMTPPS